MDFDISDADRNEIKASWAKAATTKGVPPDASTAQALVGGINFRLHLGEAIKAAWKTAKVVVKAGAAHAAPFDVFAWLEVGVEAFSAASTVFASLVQRMRPIDYVTCVVLGDHEQGLTQTELQNAVESYLNNPQASDYGWYLGLTAGLIERAKEALGAKDWLKTTLEKLRETEFVDDTSEKLKFKSRHFNAGWTPE